MVKKTTRKRRKKSVKSGMIYLFVIVLLSAAAYGYRMIDRYLQQRLSEFELENIVVQGNDILSRAEVLRLCGVKSDKQKLLRIQPNQLRERILESPYVKSVNVVASLPATLRIVIEERRPVAFIYGRGLNLIDEQGFLMPVPRDNRSWNLPFITGIKESLGTLGQVTRSRAALQALEILSYLRFLKSPLIDLVAEVDMERAARPRLRFVKSGAVVKLNSRNYQDNLFVLDRFLTKYFDWKRLTSVEYFDMRFDNQLIVKEKKS